MRLRARARRVSAVRGRRAGGGAPGNKSKSAAHARFVVRVAAGQARVKSCDDVLHDGVVLTGLVVGHRVFAVTAVGAVSVAKKAARAKLF